MRLIKKKHLDTYRIVQQSKIVLIIIVGYIQRIRSVLLLVCSLVVAVLTNYCRPFFLYLIAVFTQTLLSLFAPFYFLRSFPRSLFADLTFSDSTEILVKFEL